MLIDSHAHLTNTSLWGEIDALLARAQQAGIERIVNICTDPVELQHGLNLSKKYPWISTAAATTPHDAAKEGEAHFSIMEKAAQNGELIAIGETGLDYFHFCETAEIQQNLFRCYLRLARACELPLIIHCRDAFDDFFKILDQEKADVLGVLHCFTGTREEAKELIQRGWMISLSGIVTFKKSQELQQIACEIPLSQLLIETDAPYLAPDPYRGKVNEPAYLSATAHFVANLRQISLKELAQATTQNAYEFFSF